VTVGDDLGEIDLLAGTWARGAPHDQFDRLRRWAPVWRHPEPDGGPGFWAVTRHAEVRAASRDWEAYSAELGGTFIPTQEEEVLAALRLVILNMDPPRHHRYRRLVSKGFTPRMIARLVADIERRAVAVVDEVCERGEVELVGDIAAKVPIQIICEMIGIEADLWSRMVELSNQLVGNEDPDYQDHPGGPAGAAAEVYLLCDAVAADRRAHPRDDLMTALVQAEVDGEHLTDAELDLFFVALLVAGNETTRNLINNAVLALIEHPGEADRLRTDPSLWPTAVEEMLRWGASIHNFRRTATRDTALAGVPIAAGDKVVLYYASANRDEAVFADPHRFDVGRSPNDHLTFGGGGVHYCLGASLARAEVAATVRQVVDRLEDLELAGEPARLRSDFINGIKRMPVRFTPTAAGRPGR
jgi:cholest-4-en-3-one 26-monooxygenase